MSKHDETIADSEEVIDAMIEFQRAELAEQSAALVSALSDLEVRVALVVAVSRIIRET